MSTEFDRIIEPLVTERAERLRLVPTVWILQELAKRGCDVAYGRNGVQVYGPDGSTIYDSEVQP